MPAITHSPELNEPVASLMAPSPKVKTKPPRLAQKFPKPETAPACPGAT